MKNKLDLVKLIAEKTGTNQKVAKEAAEAVLEFLTCDEGVMITGVVSIKWVETAERVGRNPKTGEEIKIPAKKVLKIKASKKLNK